MVGTSRSRILDGGAVRLSVAVLSLAAGLGVLLAPALARAQDADYRPLLDRMDRLERDLNLLQRQVYRGAVEPGAPASPAAPVEAGPSASTVADMELRITTLEGHLRDMTGQIEEVKHGLDQLRARLDKLVADVDVRLGAMEKSAAAAKAPETAPAQGEPMPAEAAAAPGVPDMTRPLVPPGEEGRAPADAALPAGTETEQYEYAKALLAKRDFAAAEKTLKAFVKAYPNSQLAENAEYWLGETFYIRADYTNAAVTFADGYKKFPTGAKAADNLLKLGMSLANLGEKEQACKTLAEIDKKFPNAEARIRDRAAAERKQQGCK